MKHPFSRFFGLGEKEQEPEESTESAVVEDRDEVKKIPVSQIVPNRFQPRTIFNDDKIEELSRTIHIHGIIQPIVVREYGEDQFEIIAGERRFRAVSKLGWETVPAIVKNMNDTETASVALIENLQREELSPIEEAIAYGKLLELHELTQEALAQRLGKGQSTVANKLRLLKLPEEVQGALLDKKITERHARALIPLKNAEKQVQLLQEVVEKNLNVKQTEDRVNKMQEASDKKPKPKRKAFSKDMRIAVNTIRQSLNMVSDSGINLDAEEEEHEEFYQFTIRIPKKK
ncbi:MULTISPECIES: nucleoid occlusion protein [Rossellomorea]|jgi:ParB family transcriptional regulator, chromosome partitioning protein|uniref:Nucleoid occlusion protein n=1 Tax=Rossellomorea marisflavi TaxID=189381 RepID=A0A0J5VZW3_9BACI|nr:nucleoid occlusion protein [Rossellomorea marisflavi]KQU58761.1 nucleoid occlusion protein [Bacillus sp. Leaf406]MBV6684779.1 nucleoid occlusion protein [Bacillus sp. JRC01]KMK95612.1 chromosome partitioning protein ParB [Rossellomorea marisflavi]KML02680.1 chromosome partitioning protein ParB [Rossellomorea marisflavi]KML32268.1 chromosome partitioning protein ParB [Rossellomorea marisflavi]